MRQRIIIGGVCLALALSLAGCGGQTAPEPQEPKQEVQQAEPVSMETPAPPIEVKPEAEPEDMAPADMQTDEVEDNETAPVEEVQAVDLFTTVNETVYATGTVNIRESWTADSSKVGSLNTGNSITRTGIGKGEADGWSRVSLSDGSVAFINNNYLSTTKPVVQQQQASSGKSGGGQSGQSGGSGGQSGSQGGGQTQQTPAPAPAQQNEIPAPADTGSLWGGLDFGGQQLPGINGGAGAETEGWTAIYH